SQFRGCGPAVRSGQPLLESRSPEHLTQVRAIEQDLRRVDEARAATGGLCLLAGGEAGVCETVAPAEVVPIIDMEPKRHDAVRIESLCRQAAYPPMRGRATISALGGVQLDQR